MSDQPAPAERLKRSKRDQDQRIADRITAAQEIIASASADAELAALLAARGYSAERLAEGQALQAAAQAAFSARQQAMGAQKDATAALVAQATQTRQAYNDFRRIARAVFKESAAHAALGLAGKAPGDLQQFITAARASYDAALNTPAYAAGLAGYGYPAATLTDLRTGLEALVQANTAQEAAFAAAQRATERRNVAVDSLDEWMGRFRELGKVATRGRADLAQKLGM